MSGTSISTNETNGVTAGRRELDGVIDARLGDILWALWQAHGVVHGVADALKSDHCDIGNTRTETLGAALTLATEALERLADRLDRTNLCDGSLLLDVHTPPRQEVAA